MPPIEQLEEDGTADKANVGSSGGTAESHAEAAPEPWRPMKTAPKDGTIVRLLVDYRGDGCNPLEDAEITHTIGGCTDSHTGLREGWKFAGWSWEQDCFCEGRGKAIGWLPLPPVTSGVKRNLPHDPQSI